MIERHKTRYEIEREKDARLDRWMLALATFLIGFLMGWVANGGRV